MKQIKVVAGLTHQYVQKEVNQWLADNQHLTIENVFQSEWAGDSGRSFTITLFYEDVPVVKEAIPVRRRPQQG